MMRLSRSHPIYLWQDYMQLAREMNIPQALDLSWLNAPYRLARCVKSKRLSHIILR